MNKFNAIWQRIKSFKSVINATWPATLGNTRNISYYDNIFYKNNDVVIDEIIIYIDRYPGTRIYTLALYLSQKYGESCTQWDVLNIAHNTTQFKISKNGVAVR